jgi:hypothetical protein
VKRKALRKAVSDPIVISVLPGEGVLIAGFNFLTELTRLYRVMVEGQSPEQREESWRRYFKDTAKLRAWFHLDD